MILKELAVVADVYKDREGNDKKVWKNIGAIHATKDGKQYMTLDPMVNLAAVPRKEGDSRVYVSMFEPKAKQALAAAQSSPTGNSGFSDMDDDLPF